MNKDLIISKLCEITIHVGAFDSDVHDIDSVINQMRLATGCRKCKKLAKELSLLQEQEKTPIEQMKEAFKPIQMGANMVVDQSGIREELIKFRDYLINEWKYEYVASICDGDIDEYLKSNQ